jgi:uncharacterized protein YecT (DUF1311 family)
VTRTLAAALLVAATACSSGYRAAAPSPSPSPTASASPSPTSCLDTAQTQLDLNTCATAQSASAERALAEVLATVRNASEPARRADLDRGQRAWIAYRDTFCPTYGAGGSIDAMNVATCRANLAFERARAICDWYAPQAPEDAPAVCARYT